VVDLGQPTDLSGSDEGAQEVGIDDDGPSMEPISLTQTAGYVRLLASTGTDWRRPACTFE
jgi:hypothetical protein